MAAENILTSGFEELFVHHHHDDHKNDHKDNADIPNDFLIFSQNVTEILQKTPSDLKRLVSKECSEIQHDEILALKAIFEKDLSYIDDDCKCFKITISDETQVQDIDQVIDLWFSIPANYPNDIPIFEVEGHGGLSLAKADQLYEILLEEAYRKQHETMIFDLVCIAKEFVSAHLVAKQQPHTALAECEDDDEKTGDEDIDNIEDTDIFYYSPHFSLKPTLFTGPIHKLLERLPKDLQVVSIENILKPDLVAKYKDCKASFEAKYGSVSRKNDKKYILEPCLGFHGTSSRNMASIVRSGLKVPGEESGVGVAHGNRYGTGIYLSPSASYSLNYSDETQSLLVCSVIMGKCLKLSDYWYDKRDYKDIDSVMSPCQREMIVFNAAQVLPCFIIRLTNISKKDESPVFVQGAYSSSIEKYVRKDETSKEKNERLQKRACKWLPYGYGPSSKIEDVADSDDDEEEYGQYQMYRYENAEEAWKYKWL